ncbi:MAG: condensation domain-containing protein, partial [Acidobacteriota bacterium]
NKRLVAYLVGEQQFNVSELRSYLQQRLPEYMIPAAFVKLEKLPLSPNGKVDRRSLPVPEQRRDTLMDTSAVLQIATEEVLAGIWIDLLSLEEVRRHDNFLELGGHSLLATQLISRIHNAFNVDLPVRAIFESATLSDLAGKIEALLGGSSTLPTIPIQPISRDQQLPLSFAQQRLWFLAQLEPGTTAYNMPVILRLKGKVDIIALEQSFNAIINRHEILRTRFDSILGIAQQIILPNLKLLIPVIDLQQIPEQYRKQEVLRFISQEIQIPFDLAQAPLLRVKLLCLEDQEQVLLVIMHHIISDGWSVGIFFKEMAALYQAFANGRSLSLPPLPLQYADYAAWQRQWLQGEVLDIQLNYWKQQLADVVPLQLPTDHPRPPIQTFLGAHFSLKLSNSLTKALKALSRGQEVTLFMTMTAAFNALLYHYTGQDIIFIGTPVANRTRSEFEELIGLFLNTLVIRTDLSGNPSFYQLLNQVRAVTIAAHAHQDLPFEKLVEALELQRDLSRTPLFQVMINMFDQRGSNITLPGLASETSYFPEAQSKFDLTLYIMADDDTISLGFTYNTTLFEEITIRKMAERFQTLLHSVVVSPDKPLSHWQIFTNIEIAHPQSKFIQPGRSFIEFPREVIEETIASRFCRQVELTPDRLAIKTDQYYWTYAELHRRAVQIKQVLAARKIEAEERVALLYEFDAPMVAALLGVLMAGKTYLPLDPTYPSERLAFVLADSQASVLLTDNNCLSLAKVLMSSSLSLINYDEIEVVSTKSDKESPVSPDSNAYILYTSGTTGQPKGVIQKHRNVLFHIRNYTNNLCIDSDDKLTLLSSYGFDAAVMDIFGALLNGASLYPYSIREKGVAQLPDWLVEQGITIYHSTPTVYRYLINELSGKQDLSKVRLVVLGGEETNINDINLFRTFFSDHCTLI